MFATANQLYFFIESVFMGVITAFLYEPIRLVKSLIKTKFIGQIIDVLYAIIPLLIYLNLSLKFCFPDVRAYMLLGVLLGFIIENKSFHKTLAKVYSLVYNKTVSFIRRKSRDGRKKTKVNICRYGNVGSSAIHGNRNSCVSTYRHRRKNEAKERTRCRKD